MSGYEREKDENNQDKSDEYGNPIYRLDDNGKLIPIYSDIPQAVTRVTYKMKDQEETQYKYYVDSGDYSMIQLDPYATAGSASASRENYVAAHYEKLNPDSTTTIVENESVLTPEEGKKVVVEITETVDGSEKKTGVYVAELVDENGQDKAIYDYNIVAEVPTDSDDIKYEYKSSESKKPVYESVTISETETRSGIVIEKYNVYQAYEVKMGYDPAYIQSTENLSIMEVKPQGPGENNGQGPGANNGHGPGTVPADGPANGPATVPAVGPGNDNADKEKKFKGDDKGLEDAQKELNKLVDTDTVKYTEKTIVPHYKTKPDGSYEYDKDGKKKIEYYTATYVKITLTEPQTLQEIKTSVGDPIEVTTSKKIYASEQYNFVEGKYSDPTTDNGTFYSLGYNQSSQDNLYNPDNDVAYKQQAAVEFYKEAVKNADDAYGRAKSALQEAKRQVNELGFEQAKKKDLVEAQKELEDAERAVAKAENDKKLAEDALALAQTSLNNAKIAFSNANDKKQKAESAVNDARNAKDARDSQNNNATNVGSGTGTGSLPGSDSGSPAIVDSGAVEAPAGDVIGTTGSLADDGNTGSEAGAVAAGNAGEAGVGGTGSDLMSGFGTESSVVADGREAVADSSADGGNEGSVADTGDAVEAEPEYTITIANIDNMVIPDAAETNTGSVLGETREAPALRAAAANADADANSDKNANAVSGNTEVSSSDNAVKETTVVEGRKELVKTTITDEDTAKSAMPGQEQKSFPGAGLVILASIAGISVEEYIRRKNVKVSSANRTDKRNR